MSMDVLEAVMRWDEGEDPVDLDVCGVFLVAMVGLFVDVMGNGRSASKGWLVDTVSM